MDDPDAEDVRGADEDDTEASRRWLAIFAATDAPRTG